MPQKPVYPPDFVPDEEGFIPDEEPSKGQQMSVGGFLTNAPMSLAKNVYEGVAGAASIAKGVPTMILNAMRGKAQPEVVEALKNAPAAFWNNYAEAYGGWDNIKNTLYNDPFRVVSDLSTVLTGGGMAGVKAAGTASKVGRFSAKALKAGDAINPTRLTTYLPKKALQGTGVMTVEATMRPPAAVKAQQKTKFEASRTVAENRLTSRKKTIDWTRNKSKELESSVRGSTALTNPDDLVQFPNTFNEVAAKSNPGADIGALGDFQQTWRAQPENRGPLTQSRVLEIKRDENRMANPSYRRTQAVMPGGEAPILGEAHKELAQTATDALHSNVPGTAELDDAIRKGIIAKSAWRSAERRPHLLSKLIATTSLGTGVATGNPAAGIGTAAALMALDSPKLGTRVGSGMYSFGDAINSKELARALLLARMQEQGDDR